MFDRISIYIKETIVINNVIVGSVNHCSTLNFNISHNNIIITMHL